MQHLQLVAHIGHGILGTTMTLTSFSPLIIAFLGAVPTGLLILWARDRRNPILFSRGLRLALGGAFILLICRLVETTVSELMPSSAWLRIGLLAPVIEESARYGWIRISDSDRIEAGTLTGGAMGISENILKYFTEDISSGAWLFRALATAPFHGLAGGIQSRGRQGFFLSLILHALYNSGIVAGGQAGWLLTLGGFWGGACAWFIALQGERVIGAAGWSDEPGRHLSA